MTSLCQFKFCRNFALRENPDIFKRFIRKLSSDSDYQPQLVQMDCMMLAMRGRMILQKLDLRTQAIVEAVWK